MTERSNELVVLCECAFFLNKNDLNIYKLLNLFLIRMFAVFVNFFLSKICARALVSCTLEKKIRRKHKISKLQRKNVERRKQEDKKK